MGQIRDAVVQHCINGDFSTQWGRVSLFFWDNAGGHSRQSMHFAVEGCDGRHTPQLQIAWTVDGVEL